MRWIMLWCLVVGACATSGGEMRPRGRRNSTRIDALDARISALEGQPRTVKSGSAEPPLATRVVELEAELRALTAQVKALQTQLGKPPADVPTATAP